MGDLVQIQIQIQSHGLVFICVIVYVIDFWDVYTQKLDSRGFYSSCLVFVCQILAELAISTLDFRGCCSCI